MTQRFKLTLAYHGTHYHGWQVQPGKPTVQAAVETALSIALGDRTQVVGASRTDAGVHALGQVAHFDAPVETDPYPLQKSLSALLPPDISVVSLEAVDPTFHAQKSARLKYYAYYFYVASLPYTFWEPYTWQLFAPIDNDAMHNAAQALVGRHNFLSFCASDSTAKTFERDVTGARVARVAHPPFPHSDESPALYQFAISGTGFLKFMIRTIMGTLVEIGHGKRPVESIARLLAAQDRRAAGPTAPAKGLFLEKIVTSESANYAISAFSLAVKL